MGKATLVAGPCRHSARQGLRVRPLEPQNVSNDAAVAADGGEIDRLQAVQALACEVDPLTAMTPVFSEPNGEAGA